MIRLNVGGTVFVTTFDTLSSQPSMLSAMVKHKNPALEIDGAMFIDRDPNTFRWILNYMRGSHVLPRKDSVDMLLLKEEAEYFAVDSLCSKIQHVLCPVFSVSDNVRVRGFKFTITHVKEDGYIVTRGGKGFRINSSENLEHTTIEIGDVIMPYDKGAHKRRKGICMGVFGKQCTVQFDGDVGQHTCILSAIRF